MPIDAGTTLGLKATYNLSPCCFVSMDSGNDNSCVNAGGTTSASASQTNDFIIGVAPEQEAGSPGVSGSDVSIAILAGYYADIRSVGRVALVLAGAAITRGNRLTALGSTSITIFGSTTVTVYGAATPLAAGSPTRQYVGGVALESAAAAGIKIRMLVLPQEVWF